MAGGRRLTRTIDVQIRLAAARALLGLTFRGSSAKDLSAWQRQFRTKLNDLLGDTRPPVRWNAAPITQQRLRDHMRYELELRAPGVAPVPLYLLVPRDVRRGSQAPAVVCVHGHGPFGHHPVVGRMDIPGIRKSIAGHNYDYGLQFVRRGYVVAAPCLIPFGDRLNASANANDPCAVTFVRMTALGELPIAANLRDLRWTVDFLQSRPEVDSRRIGCAGLSYGGRMTMFLAAVDRRIKVAAMSGVLNLLQERIGGAYTCGSQIVPGLLRYGDFAEIGSLIAPRPAVWETGDKDPLIVPAWDEQFRGRLRRAYRAAGASRALHFDHFHGGHRWNGEVTMDVFDPTLKLRT